MMFIIHSGAHNPPYNEFQRGGRLSKPSSYYELNGPASFNLPSLRADGGTQLSCFVQVNA